MVRRQQMWGVFLLAAAFFAGMRLVAQASAPQPVQSPVKPDFSFEVSTVKPTGPVTDGRTHINYPAGGDFSASNVTLNGLMEWAFEMPEKRILDGPAWMASERFDLQAKTDAETDRRLRAMPGEEAHVVKRKMVQALLADRFAMKWHEETRTLPAFDLVLAPGGSKLKPSSSNGKKSSIGRTYFRGAGLTAELIAEQLSRLQDKVVVDRTGLDGRYDFQMEWTPDDAPQTDTSAPSFFTALQEQLGLKLVPAKEPLRVMVMEQVEQPSPN